MVFHGIFLMVVSGRKQYQFESSLISMSLDNVSLALIWKVLEKHAGLALTWGCHSIGKGATLYSDNIVSVDDQLESGVKERIVRNW